jgi:hypothetical protein
MNSRENYLRTVEFRHPEWIPCGVGLMPATWKKYREKLEDIVVRYPWIFGPYERGTKDFDDVPPVYRKGEYYTDNWGCVWYNVQEGLEGRIVKHPLEDWRDFANYEPPDPLILGERAPREDWQKVEARMRKMREEGELTRGVGDRFFERLHFLRGFKNLMVDFMTDRPELNKLINMVIEHNMKLINKWLAIGVDLISLGDDLGTQTSLMISPRIFRKYLKPGYSIMCGTGRKAGAHVRFHSDGHILELIDDLIECGVDSINPQIRANTLDGIVKTCKGKICVSLDLDRQLFPFATPKQIDRHIKEAIVELGSKEGGLILGAECEPDVPLENIEAICQAFEEYRFYYS